MWSALNPLKLLHNPTLDELQFPHENMGVQTLNMAVCFKLCGKTKVTANARPIKSPCKILIGVVKAFLALYIHNEPVYIFLKMCFVAVLLIHPALVQFTSNQLFRTHNPSPKQAVAVTQ